MSFRPRIVVATPHSAESKTLTEWLFAGGFEPVRLTDAGHLTEELSRTSVDLLAVDASFAPAAIDAVRPHHPQLPIVVLGDTDRAAEAQAKARGALYMTRPLARDLLMCTISLAVSEPRPLRRSERQPTRLLVVAHGVPSQIIDVSKEGLRLELPRGAVPPLIFGVHVPKLGVALNVRRLWSATAPALVRDAVWYDGELSHNSRRIELAWLTLVDALSTKRTSPDVR
jgi:hypothetical protein